LKRPRSTCFLAVGVVGLRRRGNNPFLGAFVLTVPDTNGVNPVSPVVLPVEGLVTGSEDLSVGPLVGLSVGPLVGLSVGPLVGFSVGPLVGLSVDIDIEVSADAGEVMSVGAGDVLSGVPGSDCPDAGLVCSGDDPCCVGGGVPQIQTPQDGSTVGGAFVVPAGVDDVFESRCGTELRVFVGVLPPWVGVLPPWVGVLPPCVGVLPPCVVGLPPCVGVLPPGVGELPPCVGVLPPGVGELPPWVGELPPWVGVMLPFVVDPLGVVDLSKYGKYPVGPPVVGFAVVGVLDLVKR